MATTNPKNIALSAAANDLGVGLGDALRNQTEEEILARQKRLAQNADLTSMSPATLALLGTSRAY